jgi:hypothetical protein
VLVVLKWWYSPVLPRTIIALEPRDGVRVAVVLHVLWSPAPSRRRAPNPALPTLSDFVVLNENRTVLVSGLTVTVPLEGGWDRDREGVVISVSVRVAVCASVSVDVSWCVWDLTSEEVGVAVSVTDMDVVTRSVPVSVLEALSVERDLVAVVGSDTEMEIVSVGVASPVDDTVDCGTVRVNVAVSVKSTFGLSVTSIERLASVSVTVWDDIVGTVWVARSSGVEGVNRPVEDGVRMRVSVPYV